jgi:spermidine synthase
MFESDKDIRSTLMIGGGGYSYPKHFISNNTDKYMDIVEIDGQVTDIAKKYFYLDTLIDEFDLNETKRLNLITEDGRVYINKNQKKYDAILNDAFSGHIPVATLTTYESIKLIKNSLNEGGLYLSNIISSLEGVWSKFIRAEVNTLQKLFKFVYVVPCNGADNVDILQNNMVIATDEEIVLENVYNLQLSKDEIVLTDDYCPVEQLAPINVK